MNRFAALIVTLLAVAHVSTASAHGDLPNSAVDGHVIVGFERGATKAQRAAVRRAMRSTGGHRIGHAGKHVFTAETVTWKLIHRIEAMPGVKYAEPNYRTTGSGGPTPSSFTSQWYFENLGQTGGTVNADIEARAAWDLVPNGGSPGVLVGWADSGIQLDHPMLAGLNLWQNPRTPDGIDQDGDGCVDGPNGCDAVTGGRAQYDENGHGTSTAGLVFANWTGSPLAGLAADTTLISSKVLDANSRGTTAGLAAGLHFLASRGARVINVSVSGSYSEAVHEEISRHPEVLFVAAAGNSGADLSKAPTYPCADIALNVLCVTATNAKDGLSSFSNYDPNVVDIAAPGAYLPSIALGGGWGTFSGTSYAAPLVTGAAALAFSAKPTATAAEVKAAILTGADGIPTLSGKVATGGRLNAHDTIQRVLGQPITPRPNTAVVTNAVGAPGAISMVTPAAGASSNPKTVVSADDPVPAMTTTTKFSATAKRKGSKKIAVTITCNTLYCRDKVTVTAARKKASRTLKLGKAKTATITVAAAKSVKQVGVAGGPVKLTLKVK